MGKYDGGFSNEVINSEYFKNYASKNPVGGYIGYPQRNVDRDELIEMFLKSKGLQPNGISLMLASVYARKIVEKLKDEDSLTTFMELVRRYFTEDPIMLIKDTLEACNIKISPIGKELTQQNVDEIEKMVSEIARVNHSPKPAKKTGYDFEGRYEMTEGTHNKFWEVHSNPNGTFTASWGRIERGTQQSKDDYTLDKIQEVVRQKLGKGYRKVS